MSYYKEAILKHIVTNVATEGKEEYQKFFNAAMKKFGIKSPAELSDEKKKDFFNYIDKNYQAKNEENLNENPAAIAAAQRMTVMSKGKKVSVNTARNSGYAEKDPSAHKKAKSIFQRIKDKFKKKNESTKAYAKSLEKIASDRKLKNISKKDKVLLMKIADMMKNANEGKLNSKIKKAIMVAIQMSGNMTGAVDKIEKMSKGLSKDDQVAAALRLANESINEGVVQNFKPKKVRLKIPSFSVNAKLHGYETDGSGMVKQPVKVEIDSFGNDFADQLEKIMPKIVADAVNKSGLTKDVKVTDKNVYIGGTMGGIPKSFSFDKK